MKTDKLTLEKKLENAEVLLQKATARFARGGVDLEDYRAVLEGVTLLISLINKTEEIRRAKKAT